MNHPDFDEQRKITAARDPRSSDEIIQAALSETDEDRRWKLIAVLHARGSKQEYDAALKLANGQTAAERELGVDILGQLGWHERSFLEPSVDQLIELLDDARSGVVASAAVALGHRGHAKAIPHLSPLQSHPDAQVRWGVVFGLLGQQHPQAIEALISLSRDDDARIRNWATFGLGDMIDVDTPELREALRARLPEKDDEIRGEAILGLARRNDPAAYELIVAELEREEVFGLVLEAAEALGDSRLVPILTTMRSDLAADDHSHIADLLDAAIEACGDLSRTESETESESEV